MIDARKNWEGQVVDGKFVLAQYLGGSQSSAVFLTHWGDTNPQKAAIKLIPADPASADLQLSLWRRCAQLSHPNLLRLLEFGRCRLENTGMLYVVMEFAEENLSQILPQRSLTPAETRDMLQPVLDALLYLQGQGLVHNRIRPSNILAAADQLKLSSDTLGPVGESRATLREITAYDPPECATAPLSPAGDVWSLGITLVEALTQHVPTLQQLQQGELPFSESLPAPFLEIVRGSLRLDAQRRSSIAEIAACLNPASSGPSPGASPVPSPTTPPASPLAVPLSPVPPLPKARLPRQQAARPQTMRARQESASSSRFLIPAVSVALVLVAILAITKLVNRHYNTPSAASSSLQQQSPTPNVQPPAQSPAAASSRPSQKNVAPPPASNSLTPASEKEPAAKDVQPIVTTPMFTTQPSTVAPKTPGTNTSRGEVLDQVLPEVSQKARDTIQGKVRVTVRVHVDPSGNVTAAELDSPSPSKYFGDLALQAARRWEFQSPEADAHSLPSEWLLRFEFSQTGTQVFPRQQAP